MTGVIEAAHAIELMAMPDSLDSWIEK